MVACGNTEGKNACIFHWDLTVTASAREAFSSFVSLFSKDIV